MTLDLYMGLMVITSLYLTVSREVTVERTWKERLWSWPWRPWVLTAQRMIQVPSDDVMRIGYNTIVMHPEKLKELRRQLEVGDSR